MNNKCNCCDDALFGMQLKTVNNAIVGIINGNISNGYKKNELFDANAVMDLIYAATKGATIYWEVL